MALILAGGAGTRLRPLSSDENPKQFLPIFDGRSLLQKTYARVSPRVASTYISTIDQYAEKCAQQLGKVNILTEPSRRNNAPAIALCCREIEAREGDVVIAVLPSDHFIGDEKEFVRVLDRAFEFAESKDYLVTLGIEPTEPNTGYGYLQLGRELEPGVIAVDRFLEKPSREKADAFLRAGTYAWNAGIFVWRASVFRSEMQSAAPEIAAVTRENYEQMPSVSIDYALMEKASRVAAIRGDFGWSDVGSFEALERVGVDVAALLNR
ncbi:MAG: mannose-1-phosphate guanylyltransferase [Acidobacteriota bacterium]|nr:mannose-1-phosphate guanylyltransferase [Acidobacteriota bacterium]